MIALPHPRVRPFLGQLYFPRLLKSAFTCCTKCVVEAFCLSKAALKRCCVASICFKRASIADCRCEMSRDHSPTVFEYRADALCD